MDKIFVANRGEIAVRVIRAAHDLGIEAVAMCPSSDTSEPHVRLADRVVEVPSRLPRAAYLDGPAIVRAALESGCDALHPGYGFRSENAAFAGLCEEAGLVFVGPPVEALRLTGDKVAARRAAEAAGVPVVPGSTGALASADEAVAEARVIGYPVLVKASGGGGGRGIRVVESSVELPAAFDAAAEEARISFGIGDIYLERYLTRVRHIEVQVLADAAGHAVWLGERECSIQRRHQKLLEESPAPTLAGSMRSTLASAGLSAAQAFGYVNAGTVEFLYDLEEDACYFIEMNSRIQVEHPVTEMVTGVDIVVEQLRVASGLALSFTQDDVRPYGHAIECRVAAENPSAGFMPSPGTLTRYQVPGGPGVRVDGYLASGDTVPPYYDSLIAKVIAHGPDRPTALARMRRALREFDIGGIATTIPFHRALLSDKAFVAGDLTTTFLSSFDHESSL